jgi:cyclopropane-fatty-acyl-phospholipid synthase
MMIDEQHLSRKRAGVGAPEDTQLVEHGVPMPDPLRWPGLSTPPRAPLRAAIASRITRRALDDLPIRATFPDGSSFGAGDAAGPQMVVRRPDAFFARLGTDAKLGFGEAYMVGDWETGPGSDLADLLAPFARNVATLVPRPLQRLRRLVEHRQPAAEESTPAQARQNISRHYDLSNNLFASFLD